MTDYQSAITHCDNCGCSWLDDGLNPIGCPYCKWTAQSAEIKRLRAEVSELRAARIAYASEFPKAEDGGPDTESIHANIRLLKARAERLAEALRLIESAKDRGFGIDYARGVAQSVLLYDQEKGHEQ